MYRISIILFFIICFIQPSFAQKGNDLRTAKELFTKGRYYDAASYFEKVIDADPKNTEALHLLAESYYLARDYKKAQAAYKASYDANNTEFAKDYFMYGSMLKMNGNYDEAKKVLDEFQKSYKAPDAADWKRKAKTEKEGCDLAKTLMAKPLNCVVNHLDKSVNSAYTEYAPIPVGLKQILFSAMKSDEDIVLEYTAKNEVYSKIYSSSKPNEKDNTKFEEAAPFDGPFNSNGEHVGDGCFSTDRKSFYFTKGSINDDGIFTQAIYVSKKEKDGKWGSAKKLGEEVNQNGISSTSPSVAVVKGGNEILYFVTERTGGVGGKDIWFVTIDKNGVIKQPTNCGRKINTEGDEITPFYDAKSSTLYYSSNGLPGIGGFDIFAAKGNSKKFTQATNIGFPINSSVDDMYYVTDKNSDGYFVSNRPGIYGLKGETCCDDIFSFTYPKTVRIAVKGFVVESIENELYYSNGGSTVTLASVDPESKDEITIDLDSLKSKREYLFELLPNTEYKMTASKPGYFTGFNTVSTMGLEVSDTLDADIKIIKIITNKSLVIKDIYYDFDSPKLKQDSKAGLDTLLMFMNDNEDIIVEIGSHTDSKGADDYNEKLSQSRAASVVTYLIENGIDSTRLVAKGYGEKQPVAPNENPDGTDNPENRQLNRRTELKIIGQVKGVEIQYESNRSKFVSPEAKAKATADSLAKVAELTKKVEEEAKLKSAEEEAKKAAEAAKAALADKNRDKDKDKGKPKKLKDGPCPQYEAVLDKNGVQKVENFRMLYFKSLTAKPDELTTECELYKPLVGADGKPRKEKSKILFYKWQDGINKDSVLQAEEVARKLAEEKAKIKDLPVDGTPETPKEAPKETPKEAPKETPKEPAKADANAPCKDYKPILTADKKQKFHTNGEALFIKDVPAGTPADKAKNCANYKPLLSKDGKTQLKTPEGKAIYTNATIKNDGASSSAPTTAPAADNNCKDFIAIKDADNNPIIKDGKAWYIKKQAGAAADKSPGCANYKPLFGKDGKTQLKSPKGELIYFLPAAGEASVAGACDKIETYFDAKNNPVKIDGKQVYVGPAGCKDYTPAKDKDGKIMKTPDGRTMYF